MGPKKTVLIVDHGSQLTPALESRLVTAGHDVVTRSSGASALAWLRTERADLLLVEIALPDMSAFELCRRLPTGPWAPSIPVIFLALGAGDVREALEAQAAGHIYIPLPPSSLQSLQKVMGLVRMFLGDVPLVRRFPGRAEPCASPPPMKA
jgi:CheY-like chemotaxis protein